MVACFVRITVATLMALALAGVSAFQWTPFEFGPGDQHYTIEIRAGEAPVTTLDVTMLHRDDGFHVSTVLRFEQDGVAQDDLATAMFGGQALGMFGLGPMLVFGPSAMMLPMLLGEEEVRVREEPLRVMGFGSLHMEREEVVAGHTCVVMRLELDVGDDVFEFAVAEGLPLPCFSRYGSGADQVEMRLLRAD